MTREKAMIVFFVFLLISVMTECQSTGNTFYRKRRGRNCRGR